MYKGGQIVKGKMNISAVRLRKREREKRILGIESKVEKTTLLLR